MSLLFVVQSIIMFCDLWALGWIFFLFTSKMHQQNLKLIRKCSVDPRIAPSLPEFYGSSNFQLASIPLKIRVKPIFASLIKNPKSDFRNFLVFFEQELKNLVVFSICNEVLNVRIFWKFDFRFIIVCTFLIAKNREIWIHMY